jgi:hypothetical protein
VLSRELEVLPCRRQSRHFLPVSRRNSLIHSNLHRLLASIDRESLGTLTSQVIAEGNHVCHISADEFWIALGKLLDRLDESGSILVPQNVSERYFETAV